MDTKQKMEFRISNKKKKDIFISIFQLIKNSSSQVNLTVNKNIFHIQGMDKSHVCLFDLNINNEWFDYYEVMKKYELCFDTSIFFSMISTKGDEQCLVFYLDENSCDTLTIELKNNENDSSIGTKKNDYNKYFTLPLLNYEYEEMLIPSTDYDAEFSLPSKKLTDILSQLNNFGNDIIITCSDDNVDFKTKGNSGEMRVNIPVDDMSSYSVIEGENVTLIYSLTYISKLCITNKLTIDIEFSLSNDCPMKIKYDLGDNSSLIFYIAPKLADD
jgi:proliferating cell nuclear antigen